MLLHSCHRCRKILLNSGIPRMNKKDITAYFNKAAQHRDYWRKRNWYYHKELERLIRFHVDRNGSVLEIGCSTGSLLDKLKPARGVGIDSSEEMISISKNKYKNTYTFQADDIEDLHLEEKFDFIIMQDLLGHLSDVWTAFRSLRKVTKPTSRIIITYYNFLWEPAILLLEKLGYKMKQPYQNWLSPADIKNILYLNNYEVINSGTRFLFPFHIPILSTIINRYIAKLPVIKDLCLINFFIARETAQESPRKNYSCSVIIPCKNEAGNIENAVTGIAPMGTSTELIFVDGNSTDGSVDKIKQVIQQFPDKKIKLIHQGAGKGKGDAVRKGFDAAQGDILMILDGDLTVPPEDLPKFYCALAEGKGEFINGTRLVYPMEKGAMRFLNMLGNKVFSLIFTWLLEQRIKDTLCGTKVLLKKDYELIKAGRNYFGEIDPFGDFDLLFGAAKRSLKIVELPVRYRERRYGRTKISRFRHGFMLLRMAIIGFKKFKFQ